MRVWEERNVDVLRQKARILENENERLSKKMTELLREILTLKGMAPTAIELNLTKLAEQAAGKTTPAKGSERRKRRRQEEDRGQEAEWPWADPAAEA